MRRDAQQGKVNREGVKGRGAGKKRGGVEGLKYTLAERASSP